MGDTEKQPIKAESGTLSISPFRDPVKDVKIASTDENPLYGYYGYLRYEPNMGIKRHSGFDYTTKEEPPYNSEDTKHSQRAKSNVYPVHKGTIVRVRFGRIEAHNKPSYVLLKLNLSDLDIEVNKEGMTVTKTKDRDGVSKKKIKTFDGKEITITTDNDNKKRVDEVKLNGIKRDVIDIDNKKTKETEWYYYDENKKQFRCPLIKSINDNHFYYETCSKCTDYFINSKGKYERIRSKCFGVQVWLKIKLEKKTVYAYYAHLSELNDTLSGILNNDYKEEKNTYKFNHEIETDTCLGKIGRTGNAWNKEEVPVPHLHFECRTGIETGTQITPNNIVRTKFMAWNCPIDDLLIGWKAGEPLEEVSEEGWKDFLGVNELCKKIKNIDNEIEKTKDDKKEIVMRNTRNKLKKALGERFKKRIKQYKIEQI